MAECKNKHWQLKVVLDVREKDQLNTRMARSSNRIVCYMITKSSLPCSTPIPNNKVIFILLFSLSIMFFFIN